MLASKNVLGGLLFVVLGAAVSIASMSFGYDTLSRMGPGVFPGVIGLLMLLIGGGIALQGFRAGREDQQISFRFRPLFFVTLSVVIFASVLRPLGLVVSLVILIVITRLAGDEIKFKQLAIQTIALTAAAVLIFYYGLGVPLNLWPR